MPMNKFLIAFTLLSLTSLNAFSDAEPENYSVMGPIELDNNGNILKLDYGKAVYHCEAKGEGARLPTPREYAELSEQMGAQGLSETKIVEYGSYRPVYGYDSEGNKDLFYFSHIGYRPPEGDSGRHVLWTSSGHQLDPGFAYLFYSGIGSIRPSSADFYEAFRCVDMH